MLNVLCTAICSHHAPSLLSYAADRYDKASASAKRLVCLRIYLPVNTIHTNSRNWRSGLPAQCPQHKLNIENTQRFLPKTFTVSNLHRSKSTLAPSTIPNTHMSSRGWYNVQPDIQKCFCKCFIIIYALSLRAGRRHKEPVQIWNMWSVCADSRYNCANSYCLQAAKSGTQFAIWIKFIELANVLAEWISNLHECVRAPTADSWLRKCDRNTSSRT